MPYVLLSRGVTGRAESGPTLMSLELVVLLGNTLARQASDAMFMGIKERG